MKNVKGKNVWLYDYTIGHPMLKKDDKYTIEDVIEIGGIHPDGTLNKDHWRHYLIKKEDGTTKIIKETECVICPPDTGNTTQKLTEYLNDNGIHAEVIETSSTEITVIINWGDWKHEHQWADKLMEYLDYHEESIEITEENGSDCYSAKHNYIDYGKTKADLVIKMRVHLRERKNGFLFTKEDNKMLDLSYFGIIRKERLMEVFLDENDKVIVHTHTDEDIGDTGEGTVVTQFEEFSNEEMASIMDICGIQH